MDENIKLNIGSRLKDLRKQNRFSILELSKLSEVSTGIISQIERDKVVPSVVTLYKISNALHTHISYFFDDPETTADSIIKKGTHKKIIMNDKHGIYEILSSGSENTLLDMVKVTLEPGEIQDELGENAISHKGEECGYVIEGTLTLLIDGVEYTIEEGNSVTFASTKPHRYLNRSDVECTSIWAMTPQFF